MRKLILLFFILGCESQDAKQIEVNFHNQVVGKLPIEFHSMSPYVKLNPGEESSVIYRFTNISPEKVSIITSMETEKNSVQVIEHFNELELREKETKEVIFKFRIPSNINKEKEKLTIKFLAKRDE